MQIYNADAFDTNSRFLKALLCSLAAAFAGGILYGLLYSFVRIQMQIIYIFIGYCIGMVIQKTGRGVTKKFAVLGAVMAFAAIFIGDTVSMFGINGFFRLFTMPSMWGTVLRAWLSMNLSTGINSLLGLIFRISGIVAAYRYAVIF